jgi:hypothetical protein
MMCLGLCCGVVRTADKLIFTRYMNGLNDQKTAIDESSFAKECSCCDSICHPMQYLPLLGNASYVENTENK